jgi:hypothetical protein
MPGYFPSPVRSSLQGRFAPRFFRGETMVTRSGAKAHRLLQRGKVGWTTARR